MIAGFFYVSNWYQIWEGLGYTAAGDFAPLRHLWSLAVEEQFYLFWPVVMIFLLGRNGTRQVAAVSRWLFVRAVLITVRDGAAVLPGPDRRAERRPPRPTGGSAIARSPRSTPCTSGTISRLSGISARRGVRDGLASARDRARARCAPRAACSTLWHWSAIIGFGWLCWNTYLVTAERRRSLRCSAADSSSRDWRRSSIIAAVTHRGAYAESAAREPGVPVGRHALVRAVPLSLADLSDDPRRGGQQADGVASSSSRWLLTVVVTELSYRFVETPIRQGKFSARWRRIFGGTPTRRPRWWSRPACAMAAAIGFAVGSTLLTAPLEQNEIAQALDAGEEFTTDLLAVEDIPVASTTTTSSTSTTTTRAVTTAPAVLDPTLDPTVPDVSDVVDSATTTTVPPTTVPPTTAPPTTAPPTPVGQLGVVTSLDGPRTAGIPPTVSGFPLVALGDSVMLGAAEELQAARLPGRRVAEPPDERRSCRRCRHLKDNGTFGSVVVIHLGTNGGFSQETLDAMLATLADVPGRAVAHRQGRPGLDRRQQCEAPRRAGRRTPT